MVFITVMKMAMLLSIFLTKVMKKLKKLTLNLVEAPQMEEAAVAAVVAVEVTVQAEQMAELLQAVAMAQAPPCYKLPSLFYACYCWL